MSSPPSRPPDPCDQPPSSTSPSRDQDKLPAVPSSNPSSKASLMPPSQAELAPLSPAHRRTLKKIIDDVKSSSPAAPNGQNEGEAAAGIDLAAGEESSDPGCEDEVTYIGGQHENGDEASDGYADEDKSMDLSDGKVLAEEQKASTRRHEERANDSADEREYVSSDGDTIEDMMNLPGKTAPLARQQDLVGIHVHDEPVSKENKNIKQQRAVIEATLEAERLEHERQEWGGTEVGVDEAVAEHKDDTMDLSDDLEICAMEATQAESGMTNVANETDGGIELEPIEPSTRRKTQLFSPIPILHRAPADRNPPIPALDFSSARAADRMHIPTVKHVDFKLSVAIPDTPFSKTLNYFKQHQGKENSPTKSRRNASLPEEIAQLAREANEDEGDLEKYREMDLAPMEPVPESAPLEDLVTFGTAIKSSICKTGAASPLVDLSEQAIKDTEEDSNVDMPDPVPVPVVGTVVKLIDTRSPSHTAANQCSPLSSEQNSDNDEDAESSDSTLEEEGRQLILAPDNPAFINVIEMLPEVLIRQLLAGAAHFSNKAYEALVEKLHGLGL